MVNLQRNSSNNSCCNDCNNNCGEIKDGVGKEGGYNHHHM